MRHLILIFFVFFQHISSFSQGNTNIIVQNDEHIIYYNFQDQYLVLVIEDLKDNEDNITYVPSNDGPYLGKGNICGTNSTKSELRDMAFIEMDVNKNGKADKLIDFGYVIPRYSTYGNVDFRVSWNVPNEKRIAHKSNVVPYFFNDFSKQKDYEVRPGFVINNKSTAIGYPVWNVSQYKDTPHMIWVYKIPWSDIVSVDNTEFFVRFVIHRVSNFGGNDFYGSFYYPNENSCSSNEFISYKINLSEWPFLKEKINDNNALKKQRSSYSIESIKNAQTITPEWDGVYILLKNGKYLEIRGQKYNTAGYLQSQNSYDQSIDVLFQKTDLQKVLEQYKHFMFKNDIDFNKEVLQIKLSDFKGIFVVSSSNGSNYVANASLSLYKIYSLNPDGTEMLFPLKTPNCSYYDCFKMYKVQRESLYLRDDKLEIKRVSNPNNSFLFIPTQIKKGVHSFWLSGETAYFFELID